jgi:polyvinyl alcohol dehydrogenase (cytochrome)
MKAPAAGLTAAERRAVAEYLTDKTIGGEAASVTKDASCKAAAVVVGDLSNPLRGSVWNGWGVDTTNTRFQPNPGISASDVSKLKLKWAYALPGAVSISTQPVVVGGRIFLGGRTVVALDAKSGCTIWEFKTDESVRAAVTVAKPDGTDRWMAYVGDGGANVYALDAATGELKWKTRSDDTPASRITGAPKFYNNRLFVPISSLEDLPSANPTYECCKYSGAMVSLDAVTGKILWTSRTASSPVI